MSEDASVPPQRLPHRRSDHQRQQPGGGERQDGAQTDQGTRGGGTIYQRLRFIQPMYCCAVSRIVAKPIDNKRGHRVLPPGHWRLKPKNLSALPCE